MRRPPRSLVLITVDCLRAGHVGYAGYPVNTTPFLDSLATESFVFRNAVASGVPTYYSLPALLCSRYPLALGRDLVGIAPNENTIASELKDRGFGTAAFVAANPYVSPAFGYERGFDFFRDFLHGQTNAILDESVAEEGQSSLRRSANRLLSKTCHGLPLLGEAYDELYFRYCQTLNSGRESFDALRRFPSAEVIVDCAIEWLNQNSNTPFFLWLHLMDPHAPYYPTSEALRQMGHDLSAADAKYLNSYWQRTDLGPERLRTKRPDVIALYDAGIHCVDVQIRRLTQELRRLNVWDECAFAVTADHGEEFLEHGRRFHAPVALPEELVNVPLLLRVPGFSARCDVEYPFGLVDLAPTLFDVLELPTPGSFRGKSCWRGLTGGQGCGWPVFTECAYACTNPIDTSRRYAHRLLAVRRGQYKLVVNFASGAEEFFDLASDPGELEPLTAHGAGGLEYELLALAQRHIAESYKTRDADLRLGIQMRDFRLSVQQVTGRAN